MDLESSTFNASANSSLLSPILKIFNSMCHQNTPFLVTICIFCCTCQMPSFSPPTFGNLLKFRHRETPAKTCRCPVDAEALDPVTANASIIGVPADLGLDVVGSVLGTMRTGERRWCFHTTVHGDKGVHCRV